MKTVHASRLPSPLGPLWAVVDEAGALLQLDFVGARNAPEDEAAFVAGHRRSGRAVAFAEGRLAAVARQLGEYFAGERRSFDLAVAAQGSPFQRRVWETLRRIPYGATRSYGELARELGRPSAARAVGRANGSNPVALVVPCHRVIGASGALTGYAGGVERKRALLELEGVLERAG